MFIFVAADNAKIKLSIDNKTVGSAATAPQLAVLFAANSISFGSHIHCSSSIDFCEEEGFEQGAAEMLITEAIEMVDTERCSYAC